MSASDGEDEREAKRKKYLSLSKDLLGKAAKLPPGTSKTMFLQKAKNAKAMADALGYSTNKADKDEQPSSQPVEISHASSESAEELVRLVNWAYRGKDGREGWTGEMRFIDGIRIDMPAMLQALEDPKATVFVASCQERPVGCIKVEKVAEDMAEVGMFAVDPDMQSKRIGSSLLQTAEEFAREALGARKATMFVLENRGDILSWYLRRGYKRTEETAPFPEDQNVGKPKIKLQFVRLEKDL